MTWITPITDRAQSDIDNKTAKGFMNVDDWNRIRYDIDHIHTYLNANGYITGNLNVMLSPTVASIPTFTNVNKIVDNINILMEWSNLPDAELGLYHLPHSYIGGANQNAPDFNDVNDWEENLNIIYSAVQGAVDYRVTCGVAGTGQTRFWQNRFR